MSDIIEVKNLVKTFTTKDATIEALKGIDLNIEEGDVFGIIGMSELARALL